MCTDDAFFQCLLAGLHAAKAWPCKEHSGLHHDSGGNPAAENPYILQASNFSEKMIGDRMFGKLVSVVCLCVSVNRFRLFQALVISLSIGLSVFICCYKYMRLPAFFPGISIYLNLFMSAPTYL